MRILRYIAGCMIVLLTHPFESFARTPATSRQAVMDTAWVYVTLKWTCHNTYTSTSTGNFIEGSRYVGEAYRYGGNDHWKDFLDKVEVQKLKPRQQAGIDCSAFVSRCWGISRQTTGTFPDLSHAIPREMLQPGDILNNTYQHVVLVESVPTDYAVIVREATGGLISRVVRRSTTWSRYSGYVPRTLVDLSPDSASVREYVPGVSDSAGMQVRARIWNDGGVPISGVVGFYMDDLGSSIGIDSVQVGPKTWGDVEVPWNVEDLSAGEHTLLIRVDGTRPLESDSTNNLTTMNYSLPLTLSSVRAEAMGERIRLSWVTREEYENRGFHLYRAAIEKIGPPAYRRITQDLLPGSGTVTDEYTYSFVDTEVADGVSYVYALAAVTTDGREIGYGTCRATPVPPTSVAEEPLTPVTYTLRQNRPNPFNAFTVIEYELPERTDVALTVYDILGRAIRTWTCVDQRAGCYEEVWDGRDDTGGGVSSGIYLYRLRTGTFIETKRMILLK